VVIPVVYTLVDDFVILLGRIFGFSTEIIDYEKIKADLHEMQAKEIAERKEPKNTFMGEKPAPSGTNDLSVSKEHSKPEIVKSEA